MTTANAEVISLFDKTIIARATGDAFAKLNPVTLARNPVIFVTEVVAVMVSAVGVEDVAGGKAAAFPITIAIWLWLTVLFATFAEAVAEGRGRARAESMKRARTDTMAKLLIDPKNRSAKRRCRAGRSWRSDAIGR
jgi:K+-transporting ATPase ATPase B chain